MYLFKHIFIIIKIIASIGYAISQPEELHGREPIVRGYDIETGILYEPNFKSVEYGNWRNIQPGLYHILQKFIRDTVPIYNFTYPSEYINGFPLIFYTSNTSEFLS